MPVAHVLAGISISEHCRREALVRVSAVTRQPDRRLEALIASYDAGRNAATKAEAACSVQGAACTT
jgi:hypothetical protein